MLDALKSIAGWGGQQKTETVRVRKTRAQWALEIANAVLRAKSKDRFWLDLQTAYEHPHAFGALVEDDGRAKIAQVRSLEPDIQNALARKGYRTQVIVRMNPARVEILNPKPPTLYFANYWERIKVASVNEFMFNGVLFYQDREHMLSMSIRKPEYAHAGFLGTTGSGKTTLLYDAVLSLCMRNSPEVLSVVLCDKTGRNLPLLNGLPHLACPTLVVPGDIETAVNLVYQEMIRRGSAQDRSLADRRILLVVDEFVNSVQLAPDILNWATELGREGRGNGINLWISTQKMTSELPTAFNQNINCRFVGSLGGNEADARISSGPGSQAHRLPVGQGVFEFRNGGTVLGEETPVNVRALYIPDVERDVPAYVKDIQSRWKDTRPHFTMGGWRSAHRQERTVAGVQPNFFALLLARMEEKRLEAGDIVRTHHEWYGRPCTYHQAHQVLGLLDAGI